MCQALSYVLGHGSGENRSPTSGSFWCSQPPAPCSPPHTPAHTEHQDAFFLAEVLLSSLECPLPSAIMLCPPDKAFQTYLFYSSPPSCMGLAPSPLLTPGPQSC